MPVTVSSEVVGKRKPVKIPDPTRVEKTIAAAKDKTATATNLVARSVTMHRLIAALPIVLVNIVAVSGQYAWAREHLASWHWLGDGIFALALESIALTLGYHSHLAETENDSSSGLKIASYGFGLLVGILNFSHYAHNWQPNAVALVAGTMSALSPWLWHIYTRRISRNQLAANGLIDRRGIRLGATRWIWHPVRSFRVMYTATWDGSTNLNVAVARYNREANERLAARAARKAAQEFDNDVRRLAT